MGIDSQDRSAFLFLLIENANSLHTIVDRHLPAKVKPFVSTEDVLQETWLQALRDFQSFRPTADDSFDRWITRIAEHRVLDAIRHAQAAKRDPNRRAIAFHREGQSSFIDLLSRVAAPRQPTPSSENATKEATLMIQRAIGELTELRREAITLFFLEGRACKEIAEKMNKTVPAVNSLLFAGKQELRMKLGPAGHYFSDASDGLMIQND